MARPALTIVCTPGDDDLYRVYGADDQVIEAAGQGTDVIFTSASYGDLALGQLSASAFVVGSAAGNANDRIIYNSATGALSYDADGNGAGAAEQFANVGTGLALTASELFIV